MPVTQHWNKRINIPTDVVFIGYRCLKICFSHEEVLFILIIVIVVVIVVRLCHTVAVGCVVAATGGSDRG